MWLTEYLLLVELSETVSGRQKELRSYVFMEQVQVNQY